MSKEKRILLDGKEYKAGEAIKIAAGKSGEDIIKIIKDAGIKGRGGAGFPTGLKWSFCYNEKDPEKYIISNADEGEPGTFKDRVLLQKNPRQHFEGMVVGGLAIKAAKGYMYLRHEYKRFVPDFEKVLDDMRNDNHLGKNIMGSGIDFDIEIRLGSGAYVCGDESALLESIEGKRGEPRNKPPYTASQGFLNKPTIVNNVETWTYIPLIISKGAKWFKQFGKGDNPGTKLFSISGDVDKPGVYEFDKGVSLQTVLDEAGAKNTKAVQVGGYSGVLVAPQDFNKPLEYGPEGLPPGGSIIVYNNTRDMVEVLLNYMHFFYEESCGQCVPCREGTYEMVRTLEKIKCCEASSRDIDKLTELAEVMTISSKCGLGQTVPTPFFSAMENFKEEFLVRECAL